jgi:Rad3-related DNA helicase
MPKKNDYKHIIVEKLKKYNFKIKEHQVNTINKILISFIDESFNYVVLSAPTGSGKSIVGFIVADILKGITNTSQSSFILMHNNALVDQYEKLFGDIDSTNIIKGSENYQCGVLNNESAKICISSFLQKSLDSKFSKCESCLYRLSRDVCNTIPHLITNYSYFFISNLYSKHLAQRLITIYDEAHEINDAFTSVYSIYLSKKRINELNDELMNYREYADEEGIHILNSALKIVRTINVDSITYKNYKEFLKEKLSPIYSSLHTYFDKCSEEALEDHDFDKYKKLKNYSLKYFNLHCKIGDFFKYNYEHVFDKKKDEFTIKPIFIRNLFYTIKNSEKHLFMSATISPSYISRTLSIKKELIKHIVVDSTFEKENKKVFFFNTHNLNYYTTNDERCISEICDFTNELIEQHINDKGIVLTPSFLINEKISSYILKNNKSVKLFEHKRGENLTQVLKSFKQYKKPSVLISPSLFVGVDLPGDISRYQIMIKSPFYSLADKRIAYILKRYPDIYNTMTLFRILQGFGRSTRDESDYSITYCLDTHIHRLFSSAEKEIQSQYSYKVY